MKIEALRRLNRLNDLPVLGKEGQLGVLQDAFFDLDGWVLRYLVMQSRSNGREVLLSPLLLRELNPAAGRLLLPLFDEEVQAIPPLDLGKPVIREQELAYNRYFCIPDYWDDGKTWGSERTPGELSTRLRPDRGEAPALSPGSDRAPGNGRGHETHDPRRQSRVIRARELYGYEAHSGDQLVGRPVDLMFDIEDLSIRYLILDLTPGRQEESKKLLLPLPWILRVEREAGRLLLRLPAEAVAHAPEYRPGEPITHAYEKNLVLHYNSLEHKV